jgi:branched-chain amino acid aminotransferase
MFFNGKEWVEYPLINADDEGFVKGYSVYEVFRTYNKIPFALKKHYKRMKKSSDFMGIEIPDFEYFLSIIDQAKKIHDFEEYRFKVYSTPTTSKINSFYLFVEEIIDNQELIEDGVIINIARERKPSNPIIPYYVKSPLNGSAKYVHKRYDYYYDSLILNDFGYVTECTFSNIFYVTGGTLITPHISSGVLPGITRKNVINLANSLSLEIEERNNIELWELLSCDEVFLTHTSRGIVPVRRIFPDFTFVVSGVVSQALMDNWKEFIMEDHTNWEGV